MSVSEKAGAKLLQFHVVKTNHDQVSFGEVNLPSHHEYEHGFLDPQDVHMKIAAVQMIAGLAKPQSAHREQTIVRILPRKILPPQFTRQGRARGWGVYAKTGYSVKKILWWLIHGVVFVVVFAVVWLARVEKTDLQNAFTPATLFFTVITILVAVAQLMG